MSNIGDLIQAYQDKHGTSDRALATRINVTATLVGRWKRGLFSELPKVDRIHALADQIGKDYSVVLSAFLADVGYLPEERDGNDRSAAPMNANELSEAREKVTGTDLSGLPNVAHKRPSRRRRDDE